MNLVFQWINDQFLKMEWLYELFRILVEDLLGWKITERLGGSLHFFLYDTVKIFLLLSTLIFFISYIQSYFPPERTKKILGRVKGLPANILAALLGTVTPFCSCSSIPLFIGFTNAGLPLGTTFSFLISSPLVDLASVILLASIFNWKIALAYVLVGLVIAVVGGGIISRAHMEDQVEPFVYKGRGGNEVSEERLNRRERLAYAWEQVLEIIRRVWLYILLGVGIGALIHNWIPETFITAILGQDKWYSVLLATVAGIPMYADIFGTLPIAEALVGKGVGIGTVLAFMMAVTALSLPSLIMLKKVVRGRLLGLFLGLVAAGILLMGYLFNLFSYLFL